MLRLIIITILFLFSLFNFFPVPSKELWYAGILIPEYPWIFLLLMLPVIWWCYKKHRLRKISLPFSVITFIIFLYPVLSAYMIGSTLDQKLEAAFKNDFKDLEEFHEKSPFSFINMLTGNGAKKIKPVKYNYVIHEGVELDLNFFASAIPGVRPCLVVVHGGSWKRGDYSEIEAVNNYFANQGYQVATINYRLAPKFHSPAPQEDVHAAFTWLRAHASELQIDTTNFLLMGRSAGAQIVLTTAYMGNENGVKGVAAFYGPNDMLWSYNHPDNFAIMDSREVQRDFLGGSPAEVPDRYFAESPLLHVSARTVPTLLVHGKVDAHVYYEQSLRLSQKLDSLGVPNFLLSLPWATHGCEYNLNGPSGQLALYCEERFFYAVTHNRND